MTLRDDKVYELMCDFAGSTRSRPESYGLFATKAAAEQAYAKLRDKVAGNWWGPGKPLKDASHFYYAVETRTVR